MDLVNIVFGVLTAALLIHIRGAYIRAEKQRSAATRLYAYLVYWRSWVLENNVFSIFYLGVEWNREIKERIANGGGVESLLALKDEKKNMIDEIRDAIEKEESLVDIKEMKRQLQRLPSNSIDYILRDSERFEQNLLEGKTFLTDEDVSVLDSYYSQLCVGLKMQLIALVSKGIGIIITIVGDPDGFSVKENSKEISDLIWTGVLASKNIDDLFELTNQNKNKSVLRRTWENMWL